MGLGCGASDGDLDTSLDTAVLDIENCASAACPPDSPHTWESAGGPILWTWCTPCHGGGLSESARQGAPIDVILDSHEDALYWADRVQVRTLDERSMPPLGSPTEDDLAALAEWLACGLP
jgi:uncharacterized membrane protein